MPGWFGPIGPAVDVYREADELDVALNGERRIAATLLGFQLTKMAGRSLK